MLTKNTLLKKSTLNVLLKQTSYFRSKNEEIKFYFFSFCVSIIYFNDIIQKKIHTPKISSISLCSQLLFGKRSTIVPSLANSKTFIHFPNSNYDLTFILFCQIHFTHIHLCAKFKWQILIQFHVDIWLLGPQKVIYF